MKDSGTTVNRFRKVKIIQLIIVSVIDVLYFCLLMFNKSIRSNVFGNEYLFIICLIAWIVLTVSLIFILIDLNLLSKIRD